MSIIPARPNPPLTSGMTLPVRARSLTEQVQDMLESLLWSGTMRPGDRTSIRELAEQLGVSTMPVREAVSRLVAQDALTVERNRAIVVPYLSEADFRDLTDVRILLEGMAVRKAVPRIPSASLAELRTLNDAFAKAMTDTDANDAVLLNQKLHFSIYAASGSPAAMQLISTCWLKAGPMISLDIGLPSRRRRNVHSVQAHAAMLDAIAEGNAEGAVTALTSDIRTAADYIIDTVLKQER